MQMNDYREATKKFSRLSRPSIKDVLHLIPESISYRVAGFDAYYIGYSINYILENNIPHTKHYRINGHEYDADLFDKLQAELMIKELEISSSIDTLVKDTDYIMDSLDAAVSEEAIRYYTDYE